MSPGMLCGRSGPRWVPGATGLGWFWSLVDRRLWSGGGVRPVGRVQLVIGDGASVLVRSVGGQVLCSHTGGVLKRVEGGGAGQKKGNTGRVNVGKEKKGGVEIDDKMETDRRTDEHRYSSMSSHLDSQGIDYRLSIT